MNFTKEGLKTVVNDCKAKWRYEILRSINIFFRSVLLVDEGRLRIPNEFPNDVSSINYLRMGFSVTEVVTVVRHEWMGDLVFARDGETGFKGDVTVFLTLHRKHGSLYRIVYRSYLSAAIFSECNRFLSVVLC